MPYEAVIYIPRELRAPDGDDRLRYLVRIDGVLYEQVYSATNANKAAHMHLDRCVEMGIVKAGEKVCVSARVVWGAERSYLLKVRGGEK